MLSNQLQQAFFTVNICLETYLYLDVKCKNIKQNNRIIGQDRQRFLLYSQSNILMGDEFFEWFASKARQVFYEMLALDFFPCAIPCEIILSLDYPNNKNQSSAPASDDLFNEVLNFLPYCKE